MSKELFTIGEMGKMTGVSVSALRFYDQMGLIKPSYVDENTGFRYYGYEHFWQIEIIKMCRDMKLPLKNLKGVLESQDDRKFMDFLEEQRISAKAELKRLKGVVSDISWMERQWEEKAKLQKGPPIYKKRIPQRKVIAAWWEDDLSNDALHQKLQRATDDELNSLNTIKRHYGYILEGHKFLAGEIDTRAEYLELEQYRRATDKEMTIIPTGEYMCCITKLFSSDMNLKPFLDCLSEKGIQPKMVIASEVALTFFDWKECLFEVQVLL